LSFYAANQDATIQIQARISRSWDPGFVQSSWPRALLHAFWSPQDAEPRAEWSIRMREAARGHAATSVAGSPAARNAA
jgi:hypothetical protein